MLAHPNPKEWSDQSALMNKVLYGKWHKEGWECEGEEEEEEGEEEEGLLTNNEWMSVGRHNTLSEEEEEEGLFKADAVNEEDPERDRATQV